MTNDFVAPALQTFAASVLLVLLLWVVHLIRRQRLNLRDSLLWLISTVGALFAALFPITLRWLAEAIGIAVPSNAVFALAFLYVIVNLLAVTIAISRNAAHTRRLTQECAILRAEIDALRNRLEQPGGRV